MANSTSNINVVVTGTDQLRTLNTSLNTYKKHIEHVISLHTQLGNSTNTLNINVNGLSNSQAKLLLQYTKSNTAILNGIKSNTDFAKSFANIAAQSQKATNAIQGQLNSLQKLVTLQQAQINAVKLSNLELKNQVANIRQAQSATNGMNMSLGTMVTRYASIMAISAAFMAITNTIKQSIQAAKDFDYQTARTTRVTGTSIGPFVNSSLKSASARSGLDTAELGTTMYTLGTFIKGTDNLTKAFNSTVDLLIGTEGDAQQVTRSLIFTFEQFKDSMGSSATDGQKFQRVTELMATAFHDANAEINELAAGMKYLGPIAQAAHIPLEQVVATLTTLTSQGQIGRMGGTEAAQFVSQLVKNYNDKLGGIVNKGEVYKFPLIRITEGPDKGGVDIVATLTEISKLLRSLPTEEAIKVARAIGGAQNSFRLLGTDGQSFVRQLNDELDKMNDKTGANREALEAMKRTMEDTFQVAGAKAWNAVLVEMSEVVQSIADKIGLIQGFKTLGGIVTNEQTDKTNSAKTALEYASASPAEKLAITKNVVDKATAIMHETRNAGTNVDKPISIDDLTAHNGFNNLSIGGLLNNDLQLKRFSGLSDAEAKILRDYAQSHGASIPVGGIASTFATGRTDDISLTKLGTLQRALRNETGVLNLTNKVNKRNAPNGSLESTLYKYADQYGVPRDLAFGLAKQESGLNQYKKDGSIVTSSTGALGVMQLMPGTAKGLGVNPRNPDDNIKGGMKYMGDLYKHWVSLYGPEKGTDYAIANYNGGVNAVKNLMAGHPWDETRGELSGVHRYMGLYGSQNAKQGDLHWDQVVQKTPDELKKEAEARRRAAAKAREDQIKGLKEKIDDIDYNIEDAISFSSPENALATIDKNYLQYEKLVHSLVGRPGQAGDKRAMRKLIDLGRKKKKLNIELIEGARQTADANYSDAVSDNGAYSSESFNAALKVNTLEIRKAELSSNPADLQKVYRSGTLAQTIKTRNKASKDFNENKSDYQRMIPGITIPSSEQQSFAGEQGYVLNSTYNDIADKFIRPINKRFNTRYKDLQYNKRPDYMYYDSGQEEISNVYSEMSANRAQKGALGLSNMFSGLGNTEPMKAEVEKLDEQFRSLQSTLQNINDRHQLDLFNKSVGAIDKKYNDKSFYDSINSEQRIGETDTAYHARRVNSSLVRTGDLSSESAELSAKLTGLPTDSPIRKELQDKIDGLKKEIASNTVGTKNLTEEQARSRYENAKSSISSSIQSSLMNLYHGSQRPLDALNSVSDAINTQLITNLFTPMFEPLISSMALQVSAQGENTLALNNNTTVLQGGSPTATVNGNPVSGGTSGSKPKSGSTMSNIGMGLAAYGALSNGLQSGNPISGAIGGVMAGAAFGPVGMAVGGALGLIGGLFGGHKKSQSIDQAKDPALYNAPSEFVYRAYEYRATGRIPNLSHVQDWRKNAPIVNVFVDGVKAAVDTQLTQQSNTTNSSQTNTTLDYHKPI